MKINRVVGLLIFLFVGQLVLGEVFTAVFKSIVATMGTIETASNTATVLMQSR